MHRSAKRSALTPNFSFDFQIKPYLLILKKLNSFEPSLNVINIDTHTMQNVLSFYLSDIWTKFENEPTSLNVINIDTHTMQNVFSFYPSDIWTEFENEPTSLNVINIDTQTMQNVFSFYPSDIWTEFEKMYRVYSTSKTFSIAIFSWFFNMFL